MACKSEQELRPVLLTPTDWNCNKNKVNTQLLQELGYNVCLTLHSIPGSTNIRYMFLARTAQWQLQNGTRKLGFSMTVTDSKANQRMRHVIEEQETIKWLTEGWAYFTITEVDGNAIDVVYEHCVGCESQIHAENFFIQLAEFVCCWEQAVSPNLLCN
ncbi:hypothetical protein PHMEG_00011657 [Phytophthora megakarya]|uniref:Uncharacterized protein n=1 Tax=Phytophthora megakarya TaxID=4795 RepID=A0A225WAN2_9STRA|nr:hypothetical protein PHMEG_00011657 [Phytophthora megakarya]